MLMRSEVTLSAELDRHVALLVLEIVGASIDREGASHRTGHRSPHVAIELGVHDFVREGQVLDRSPAGGHADFSQGEARITRRYARTTIAGRLKIGGAPKILPRAVVAHAGDTAEQAARPVGIPVVVERTTDTPRGGEIDAALARTAKNTVADGAEHDRAGAAGGVRDEEVRTTERTVPTERVLGRTRTLSSLVLAVVPG